MSMEGQCKGPQEKVWTGKGWDLLVQVEFDSLGQMFGYYFFYLEVEPTGRLF